MLERKLDTAEGPRHSPQVKHEPFFLDRHQEEVDAASHLDEFRGPVRALRVQGSVPQSLRAETQLLRS